MSDHWKCVARGWSRLRRRVAVPGRGHSVGFRARGRDPEQARPVHLSGGTPDRAVPPQPPCTAGATHRAPNTPEPRRVQRKRPLHQPTPPSTDDDRSALGAPTTVGKASAGPPPRAAATDVSEPRFPSGTQSTSVVLERRWNPTPHQDQEDTGSSLSRDRERSPSVAPARRSSTPAGQDWAPSPNPSRPSRQPPPTPSGPPQNHPLGPRGRAELPRRTRSSSAWPFRASPSPRITGS